MTAARKSATWPPTYDQLCRRLCLFADALGKLAAELDVVCDRERPLCRQEREDLRWRVGEVVRGVGLEGKR